MCRLTAQEMSETGMAGADVANSAVVSNTRRLKPRDPDAVEAAFAAELRKGCPHCGSHAWWWAGSTTAGGITGCGARLPAARSPSRSWRTGSQRRRPSGPSAATGQPAVGTEAFDELIRAD